MQPNAPAPGPPPAPIPPASQSPYDFIMQEPVQKPGFSLNNRKQLIFIGAVVLVVLTLVLIIGSMVTGSGKSTTETLISLTQEQAELARVADIGTKKARSSQTKALAITVSTAVTTTEQDTLALLKKQHHKLNAKQLSLKKNTQTDTELTSAALDNTFDDAFAKYMQTALANYQKDVKQAYEASTNKTEKAILASSYNGMNTILSQEIATGSSASN